LQSDVEALRTLVQAQQAQLRSLNEQLQAQPLTGLTTDSPAGMALEGLLLGLVALGLGFASFWGSRAPLQRTPPKVFRTGADQDEGFSDSLLYLADQDDLQSPDAAPVVTTHLHDPLRDAKASTLAHEEGDAALQTHRLASTAQGLSVTAGAGHVDSDRVPLDVPATPTAASPTLGVFGTAPTSEFDQRAAAEEVERVRRYLAQRRAARDRAMGLTSDAGTDNEVQSSVEAAVNPASAVESVDIALDFSDSPAPKTPPTALVESQVLEESEASLDDESTQVLHVDTPLLPSLDLTTVTWNALLPAGEEAAGPLPQLVGDAPLPVDPEEEAIDIALSEGASLLASFSDSELAPYADIGSAVTHQVDGKLDKYLSGATAELLGEVREQAEPQPPLAADVNDTPEHLSEAGHAVPENVSPGVIHLELAREFRDLGLWEEARERALEALSVEDSAVQEQARTLLDELALTAAAPLNPDF
jgi:hypothetical protein